MSDEVAGAVSMAAAELADEVRGQVAGRTFTEVTTAPWTTDRRIETVMINGNTAHYQTRDGVFTRAANACGMDFTTRGAWGQ